MDEHQKGFLTEVLNTGAQRAGAVLGELVQRHVNLSVPDVDICPVADLPGHLSLFQNDQVTSVTMGFSGVLSGDAVLLLSGFSGILLTQRLMGGATDLAEVQEEKQEAISEVGNIVVNNFVGAWAEVFHDRFTFGLPQFEECGLNELLDARISGDGKQRTHAIWANAHFDVSEFFIVGTLLTLFDQASVERLVGAVSSSQAAR
ncbi:MAG: hypothetical protein KKA42_03485 [candidate division Zixibacteria bacterium]|nr:hypothetical protein [candidate division Zixibacteria bacterium]